MGGIKTMNRRKKNILTKWHLGNRPQAIHESPNGIKTIGEGGHNKGVSFNNENVT